MCAPSNVGAMEPDGMTKASTTKARKTKARMKATRMDSMVSLMFSFSGGGVVAAGGGVGGGAITGGIGRGGMRWAETCGALGCGSSIITFSENWIVEAREGIFSSWAE